MKTSLSPIAVYSSLNNNRLTGSSVEGIIFDLIKQIEVFVKLFIDESICALFAKLLSVLNTIMI
jgi:hypothetical protein